MLQKKRNINTTSKLHSWINKHSACILDAGRPIPQGNN